MRKSLLTIILFLGTVGLLFAQTNDKEELEREKREIQNELKEIQGMFGSRIKFIFRDFPLPMHDKAYDAAVAAEAAGMQGKFWDMHNMEKPTMSTSTSPWLNHCQGAISLTFDDGVHQRAAERETRTRDSAQTQQTEQSISKREETYENESDDRETYKEKGDGDERASNRANQ